MTNPFRFRPFDPDDLDWADNPVSNLIAWLSISLQLNSLSVLHKIANPFWTDCPTCLFFRGVLVGATIAALIAALI